MLQVFDLSAGYDQFPVIRSIDLKVEAGEIVALIGPNGAGKSTLIRAISGLIDIQSGHIQLGERDSRSMDALARARQVAVVPQARELPRAFTVYQTVALGRTPYLGWIGRAGPDDEARVEWALEQTDCQGLAERHLGTLSGGEQQRVLLARALVQDTPILLLDEPTTHLDLQHQIQLLDRVRGLARSRQLAVLAVLHDLNLAGQYADRITLLNEGVVQVQGSPESVLTQEHLGRAYHIDVHVLAHPDTGTPLILPRAGGDPVA
jgi:iron complex transport system ATP-binding protein